MEGPWTEISLQNSRKRLREAETEVLLSKAHASKVETELSRLKREAREKKIIADQQQTQDYGICVDRVHSLEVERKKLVLELKNSTDELKAVKHELDVKKKESDEYKKITSAKMGGLERMLTETVDRACSAELEGEYLREHSKQLEEKHKVEVSCLKELCSCHETAISHLKERLSELATRVLDDASHREEVESLKKSLASCEEEAKLVKTWKDLLSKNQNVEVKALCLEEENKLLYENCANSDLLKYKVSSLEEKLKRSEVLREELSKLQIENESLKERLSKWSGSDSTSLLPSSPHTVARRLAELQQSECLLKNSLGQKDTDLKVSQKHLFEAKSRLLEVGTARDRTREEARAKEEQLKRMDRKLIFVTKERDGLANVLSTYKLDAGVDQQLKGLLTETEASLDRAHLYVKELEEQLAASSSKDRPSDCNPSDQDTRPRIQLSEDTST